MCTVNICLHVGKHRIIKYRTVHGERARCDHQIGTRTLFVYDNDSIKGEKQKCDCNQCEKQRDAVTAFGVK
jgi:hypothetical protein